MLNVTLSPSYIGNYQIGVKESLNACLMRWVVCKMFQYVSSLYMCRYREDLKGVMVCYSKLQLVQKTGKIIDETPNIHFNVRTQALVFRPVPGMKLVGTVNKVHWIRFSCDLIPCPPLDKRRLHWNACCWNFQRFDLSNKHGRSILFP